jgi:fumarylacetoacetase
MGICAAWTLLGKSFASSISPGLLLWMHWSLLESLAQTRSKPTTLFATKGKHSFDIHLEAAIQPENAEPTVISNQF